MWFKKAKPILPKTYIVELIISLTTGEQYSNDVNTTDLTQAIKYLEKCNEIVKSNNLSVNSSYSTDNKNAIINCGILNDDLMSVNVGYYKSTHIMSNVYSD